MTNRAYIVIRTLEGKIAIAENADQNTLLITLGALKEILTLLKEQEPMKPTWIQGKAYCGNCGQRLPRKCEEIKGQHCSFCGKEVKWDEI